MPSATNSDQILENQLAASLQIDTWNVNGKNSAQISITVSTVLACTMNYQKSIEILFLIAAYALLWQQGKAQGSVDFTHDKVVDVQVQSQGNITICTRA